MELLALAAVAWALAQSRAQAAAPPSNDGAGGQSSSTGPDLGTIIDTAKDVGAAVLGGGGLATLGGGGAAAAGGGAASGGGSAAATGGTVAKTAVSESALSTTTGAPVSQTAGLSSAGVATVSAGFLIAVGAIVVVVVAGLIAGAVIAAFKDFHARVKGFILSPRTLHLKEVELVKAALDNLRVPYLVDFVEDERINHTVRIDGVTFTFKTPRAVIRPALTTGRLDPWLWEDLQRTCRAIAWRYCYHADDFARRLLVNYIGKAVGAPDAAFYAAAWDVPMPGGVQMDFGNLGAATTGAEKVAPGALGAMKLNALVDVLAVVGKSDPLVGMLANGPVAVARQWPAELLVAMGIRNDPAIRNVDATGFEVVAAAWGAPAPDGNVALRVNPASFGLGIGRSTGWVP